MKREAPSESHPEAPAHFSSHLSPRECQILALASTGLMDKEIGPRLGISLNTLRTYWARIRGKAGYETRTALVANYLREQMAEMPHERDEGTAAEIVYLQAELQQCQESERRAQRAHHVLEAFLKSMVGYEDLDTLRLRACQFLVEDGGYVMAWLGEPVRGPDKLIVPLVKYGDHSDYLDSIMISWGSGPLGRGPGGRAVRTGETVVNRDFMVDPTLAPWRERAHLAGFQSSVSIPLKRGGKVFEVLTVYAPETDAFDEQELALLETFASTLAYVITGLHERQAGPRR